MNTKRLKRQGVGGFPFVATFLAFFFFALNAQAGVVEYVCPEGLSMPPVVQWSKVLIIQGDGIDAFHTQGTAITPAGDGSGAFLVAGSAWTDTGNDEYGVVVMMDQGGGIVDWATFFDISHENGLYAIHPAYNASQTVEGYIAAGHKEAWHKAPGIDNWWLEPDAWLLKVNLSLEVLWQNNFGMQGEDWANSIMQNDSGFLFGGALRDIGAVPQGGWLFQTDGSGNGLWSKSLYYYCSREDEKEDVLSDPCPEPCIVSSGDPEAGSIIHSLLPTADGGSVAGYRSGMRKLDTGGNGVWPADGGGAVIATDDGFLGESIEELGESPTFKLTRVTSGGEMVWSALYGDDAVNLSEKNIRDR